MNNYKLLSTFPIFSSLPNAILSNITKHLITKQYKKGSSIFKEGDTPKSLFLLYSGKVKLYKTSTTGKQKIVRIEKEGHILGYRSIFAGEPYKATAEVMENSSIGKIGRKIFMNLIMTHPSIMLSLLTQVSQELGEAEVQLIDLIATPAEARLAKLLLTLNKKFADSNGNLNFSRAEAAEMIGTAPETVIRILSNFKNQNIVKLKKRQITVLNINALEKIVSEYL